MEKNCQKGYFLVETIISLTVVATIITVLYGTITSSFIKQNNEITRFNTTEGLYTTKEIDKYFKSDLNELKEKITDTNKYIDLEEYMNTLGYKYDPTSQLGATYYFKKNNELHDVSCEQDVFKNYTQWSIYFK